MIISIWRPVFSTQNKIKRIKFYEVVDGYENLKKGWNVIYTCDLCSSSVKHRTTTSVLLNKNVIYNTLDSQTCRSCRSVISENEIKKTFISFNVIRGSITQFGYSIIDVDCENSYYKSRKK